MVSVSTIRPQNIAVNSISGTPVKKLSCCEKIRILVKKIFLAICNLFRCKPKKISLTLHERRCLATFNKFSIQPKYLPKLQRANSKGGDQILSELLTSKDEGVTPISLQATRQYLCEFSRDLGSIVTDIVYEHHFDKSLQGVQSNAAKYVNGIRSNALLLAPVFGQGATILSQLSEHKTSKAVTPTLQKPLSWLLKNQDKVALELRILQEVQNQGIVIPPTQKAEDYVEPILDWLFSFQQNPANPLPSFPGLFDDLKFEDTITKQVQKIIFNILVEKKIDELIEKLQKIVDRKLPEIMQKMMQVNTKKITDILSNRIINLLEKVSFPETIDKIMALFNEQVLAYLSAEKLSTEILDKAKQVTANPKLATHAAVNELGPVIANLTKVGEQVTKQRIFLTEFSQHKACHRRIKQLAEGSKQAGIDFNQFKKNLEKSYFPDLANMLISFILPAEKIQLPNGQVKEIDGITSIWQQLDLLDEFKELMQSIFEMGQEFFKPEIFQGITGLKAHIKSAVEGYFIDQAHEWLKPFITRVLQRQIEAVVLPESLTELAGYTIFPKLIELLIDTCASRVVYAKADTFGPLFYDLLDKTKKEASLKTIKGMLATQVPAQFNTFSMKDAKITPQLLENILSEFINKVNRYFIHASTTIPSFVRSKSALVLKAYSDVEDSKFGKKADELYGTLFDTLVFKLGNFGTITGWVSNLPVIKKLITSTMIPALEIARKSHEGLTIAVCDAIRSKYLTKPAMEKAMFGAPDPAIPTATINAKVKEGLGHIANFGHDMIVGAFKSGPIVKFLLGNPGTLNKLITDIFQKCFTDPILNYNLFFQMQEIFTDAVSSAAIDLREQQSLNPRKVTVQ